MKRLVALVLLALLLGAPAAAVASCRQTTVLDVSNEVMCTVCGVPLDEATDAPFAQRERAFIAREVARCRTKSEIKTALAAQFGEAVLATPRSNGIGLAVYAVPVLAALLAVGYMASRAMRRRRMVVEAAEPALDRRDAARLEADLARYRG